MPDEFDFKNYENFDEFAESVEGSRYIHDVYLKAVNHPVRREILKILNIYGQSSEDNLHQKLKEKNLIKDKKNLIYNLDYLKKAYCIEKIERDGKVFYKITKNGRIIEYLK